MNTDLLGSIDGLVKYHNMGNTLNRVMTVKNDYIAAKGISSSPEQVADSMTVEILDLILEELSEKKQLTMPFRCGAYWYVLRTYILKRLGEKAQNIIDKINKIIEVEPQMEFLKERKFLTRLYIAVAQNVATSLTYRSLAETIPFVYARTKGYLLGPILEQQIFEESNKFETPYGFIFVGRNIEKFYNYPLQDFDELEKEDIIGFPIWDGKEGEIFYNSWNMLKEKYSPDQDYEISISDWI